VLEQIVIVPNRIFIMKMSKEGFIFYMCIIQFETDSVDKLEQLQNTINRCDAEFNIINSNIKEKYP